MSDSTLSAPVRVLGIKRPLSWPIKLLARIMRGRTGGVPVGLWLVNHFFQKVLDVNGTVPWMVHFTSRVTGRITIGKGVCRSFAVSGGCYIQGGNGIEIGAGSRFGPGVKIISANHRHDDLSEYEEAPPIRIGKDCWLSANVVVLPGVELGNGVVVGAGAVVTKSFPAGAVLAGVPARQVNDNVKEQD